MTENSAQPDQFTGLILLTGSDKPGIAASLFQALSPFAVHILDIEQVVINNRLILTVLIGANAAHQNAIEEDLNACALNLDVDIATLFGNGPLVPVAPNLIEVHIGAEKLHPGSVAEGVYVHWRGPAYETPAEIKMMRTLGADLVGMSTVPEAIAAHALGAQILAISLVTNAAAGVTGEKLNHAEVIAAGKAAADRMGNLLAKVLPKL